MSVRVNAAMRHWRKVTVTVVVFLLIACSGGMDPGHRNSPIEHELLQIVALDMLTHAPEGKQLLVQGVHYPDGDSVRVDTAVLQELERNGLSRWEWTPDAAWDTTVAVLFFSRPREVDDGRYEVHTGWFVPVDQQHAYSDDSLYRLYCTHDECRIEESFHGGHSDYGTAG